MEKEIRAKKELAKKLAVPYFYLKKHSLKNVLEVYKRCKSGPLPTPPMRKYKHYLLPATPIPAQLLVKVFFENASKQELVSAAKKIKIKNSDELTKDEIKQLITQYLQKIKAPEPVVLPREVRKKEPIRQVVVTQKNNKNSPRSFFNKRGTEFQMRNGNVVRLNKNGTTTNIPKNNARNQMFTASNGRQFKLSNNGQRMYEPQNPQRPQGPSGLPGSPPKRYFEDNSGRRFFYDPNLNQRVYEQRNGRRYIFNSMGERAYLPNNRANKSRANTRMSGLTMRRPEMSNARAPPRRQAAPTASRSIVGPSRSLKSRNKPVNVRSNANSGRARNRNRNRNQASTPNRNRNRNRNRNQNRQSNEMAETATFRISNRRRGLQNTANSSSQSQSSGLTRRLRALGGRAVSAASGSVGGIASKAKRAIRGRFKKRNTLNLPSVPQTRPQVAPASQPRLERSPRVNKRVPVPVPVPAPARRPNKRPRTPSSNSGSGSSIGSAGGSVVSAQGGTVNASRANGKRSPEIQSVRTSPASSVTTPPVTPFLGSPAPSPPNTKKNKREPNFNAVRNRIGKEPNFNAVRNRVGNNTQEKINRLRNRIQERRNK